MVVQLLKQWHHYQPGTILTLGYGVAIELVKRRVAARYNEPVRDRAYHRAPMRKGLHGRS